MNVTIERLKVIAKSALTWLTVLAGVLTVAAEELTAAVGADHVVVVWVTRAIAWVAVATAMIRRSTPVLEQARGILPVVVPLTEGEERLERDLAQAYFDARGR